MYLQSIAICKQTLKPTSWISNAVGERVGVGHLLGHTPTLHRYPGRQAGGGPRPALAPAPVWTPSLTADSRRARRGGQGRTQRHCQIWATIETCSRYFNVGVMVRAMLLAVPGRGEEAHSYQPCCVVVASCSPPRGQSEAACSPAVAVDISLPLVQQLSGQALRTGCSGP